MANRKSIARKALRSILGIDDVPYQLTHTTCYACLLLAIVDLASYRQTATRQIYDDLSVRARSLARGLANHRGRVAE